MLEKAGKFFIKYYDTASSFAFRKKINRIEPEKTISFKLANQACERIDVIYKRLQTSSKGLSIQEAYHRINESGANEITHEKRDSWFMQLLKSFNNPLIILLITLSCVSLITGDYKAAIVVSFMIAISVGIGLYQENQAYFAAEKLRAMVKTTCTVLRDDKLHEVNMTDIVPGDIIQLIAGGIIPADVRILRSKELFVNQSLLTGESLPVEKHATLPTEKTSSALECQNICFTGTNVESGFARAIVLETGGNTYFGSIAKSIVGQRQTTSFDKGVNAFTVLIVKFIAVMIPLVFFINGISKGNWWEAFLFAIAVAVGLTPEMLPAIVTLNLSKGAISMSKKKVIVKRLSSIQNFGAMDVLCTDKTGTLTQNKVVLIENLDINGKTDPHVLDFAYLNSYYQTGFKNLLDEAVLNRAEKKQITKLIGKHEKIDELPFDFKRRRLSVVVKEKTENKKILICKGAIKELTEICTHYEESGKVHNIKEETIKKIVETDTEYSKKGYRVIAVAYRELKDDHNHYSSKDERDMIFLGFMTFFDPPKETAELAIHKLNQYGITVKVLTGDNDLVTKKICEEVKLKVDGVLLGNQIESMDDKQLQEVAEHTTIFAKLSPDHKRRVVQALRANNHVVGFLGDGINDAPALRAADVGVSVDEAVDIAKESADIILLEMSLLVLEEGVLEGRKVFGNIIKYVKMGASSNFGNMFSVIGASILLPFLPMLPIQILTNNLLYDFSQITIPTDKVDLEYLEKPRKWIITDIRRFILSIGPISSLFDYLTFAMMWFVFHADTNPALFRTGWFVESLLTQTLVIHVIRSRKIPFLQTRASWPLIATTISIMAIGIALTYSPIGNFLGFVHLPALYWPLLFLMLLGYTTLTQIVKSYTTKKHGYN